MSTPFQDGRRLILKFIGGNKPELDRIEFKWSEQSDSLFWQQGNLKNPMSWSKVPQALALIFLDYLSDENGIGPVYFSEANGGDLVGALGNTITDKYSRLHELFAERQRKKTPSSRVKQVFGGKNIHGKEEGERRICVQSDNLPTDCIEVYWQGSEKITDVEVFRELSSRIRLALEIPVPDQPQPKLPTPKSIKPQEPASDVPAPTEPKPIDPAPPISAVEQKSPAPPSTTSLILPQSLLASFEKMADAAGKFFERRSVPRKQPSSSSPQSPPQTEASASPPPAPPQEESLSGSDRVPAREVDTATGPEFEFIEEPSPAKINPLLLQIQNPEGLEWSDSDGLIDFGGEGSDADVWRIRDACEGLLIFGSVGSGKTSGSGAAIARAYLQAGFGGLVLTAKPDEARRWLRMCEETGRASDYVHVTPSSGHKLNFLQYEIQRPGNRIGITDDLIALFRRLIDVSSHTKGTSRGDAFWTETTNQLMRKLIDIHLLAGEPLSLSRMMRFINNAPQSKKTDWRGLKMFSAIIKKGKENAAKGTDADRRIFRECFGYWTDTYPKVPDITRGGFVTSFSAMADTLSGRGIYEMIGTETNLTPEMILSGKVVVLDIPLKGNIQGGLMIQAVWKLLFQQAVERRVDKGLSTARPAFLWEDEGHEFFSEHDVRFQPTARDIRAPHVIISQNIHNFLHLGHNQHAVMAVFAAINTYIFHTNVDLDTNRWASERIGQVKKLKLTTDGLLKPTRAKDISFFGREPHEVENVGRFSLKEETKHALEPEDFMRLKRGGNGTCEAVILWLSHQFAANHNRNFCVTPFEQEQRLE